MSEDNVIDIKPVEAPSADVAALFAKRHAIGAGLRGLAESIESGEVRTAIVLVVSKGGGTNNNLHVEDGTSEPELLGMASMVEAMIDNALRGNR
jgi:hypothetical protein